MTPQEIGDRLVALLGQPADAEVSLSGGGPGHDRATVDVPPHLWASALRLARDDAELACDFFDWLTAVDEGESGFAVVAHLWSTAGRHGLLVRTRARADVPMLSSVVDVYPGAAWHERETHEMFGVSFAGGSDAPLLLPAEFEGHPLRKDFVLAARVAKPWPGAKEPGEPHAEGARKRQPMRPPGVPDDWPRTG